MSLQMFLVVSSVSSTPLAEIRTDGKVMEFIVDNTNGQLPKTTGKDFKKLTQMVEESSHLQLVTPDKPTLHLLRYMMDNGDIVEITEDGHTCLLNGRLLTDHEKHALFDAIRSGELQPKQRAQLDRPIPVLPIPPSTKRPQPKQQPEFKIDTGLINAIQRYREEARQAALRSSHYFDESIEKNDFSDAVCPEATKQLFYLLRYGLLKGEKQR